MKTLVHFLFITLSSNSVFQTTSWHSSTLPNLQNNHSSNMKNGFTTTNLITTHLRRVVINNQVTQKLITLSNWIKTWIASSGLRTPPETIWSKVSVKHIPIVDLRYSSKVAILLHKKYYAHTNRTKMVINK